MYRAACGPRSQPSQLQAYVRVNIYAERYIYIYKYLFICVHISIYINKGSRRSKENKRRKKTRGKKLLNPPKIYRTLFSSLPNCGNPSTRCDPYLNISLGFRFPSLCRSSSSSGYWRLGFVRPIGVRVLDLEDYCLCPIGDLSAQIWSRFILYPLAGPILEELLFLRLSDYCSSWRTSFSLSRRNGFFDFGWDLWSYVETDAIGGQEYLLRYPRTLLYLSSSLATCFEILIAKGLDFFWRRFWRLAAAKNIKELFCVVRIRKSLDFVLFEFVRV